MVFSPVAGPAEEGSVDGRAPTLNIPKRQPLPNLLWNASGTHASGREPPTLRPMAEEEEEIA